MADINVEPLEVVEAGPNKAWLLDHKGALTQAGIDVEQDASIASWIVQAPWAHLAWHSYWLYICHLRPMPDNRSTIFHLENATHEMWVAALDPDVRLETMIASATPRYLTPLNFASQLILPNDEVAAQTIRGAAMDVLFQRISPDTDWVSAWRGRYGDNMGRRR